MFIKFPMPCHVVGKLLLYATKGLHFFELTVNYLITRNRKQPALRSLIVPILIKYI